MPNDAFFLILTLKISEIVAEANSFCHKGTDTLCTFRIS